MRLDARLFAPGPLREVRAVATGLVLVAALRLALGDAWREVGSAGPTWHPPPVLRWLPEAPPAPVLLVAQALGASLAVLAACGLPARWAWRALLPAWCALTFCTGVRAGQGKVLHNDVLLLLALLPVAVAGLAAPRPGDERWAWAPRLARVLVAGGYLAAGLVKLRTSGLAWVTGDNMQWILRMAARGGRPWSTAPALWIAGHPLLCKVLAATLLGFELSAPVLAWRRRLWPVLVAGAAALHTATWVVLGLDYWAWTLTVGVLFWPRRAGPEAGEERRVRRGGR